jgi:inhibitor of cysteine peptidase
VTSRKTAFEEKEKRQMKTNVAILGIIALVAILVGACGAAMGSPKQTTISVGYDEFSQGKNISKQVTITEGTELIVKLTSNPSTGFSWTQPIVGTTAVLTQTDSKYVTPDGKAVGAAGTQVSSFKASAKGTSTVKMDYSRPWEGGEKAEWTFALTVTVQ